MEAYLDSCLPSSGANVLAALQGGGQADGAADADAAGGPSKRRRVETAEGLEMAVAAMPADQQQLLQQPSAPAVCPLCLGLLQLPEIASSGSGSSSSSSDSSSSSSDSASSCCPVQLITTRSALNDPARYASINWGAAAAAVADAAAAGDAQAAAAAAADEADGGAPSCDGSIAVQRQAAAVPSLAAAAAGIAEEFELDSFALEVSLPASLAVRQQALAWRLRGLHTPEGEAAAQQLRKALGVLRSH